jgi:nucleotide-binding universal stress UspA family protein
VVQGSQIREEGDIIEIKSILYPTDLLGYSYLVLPYVLLMSEKHDAEVYLLYVVRDLHHYTGFQDPHTSISAFMKEALEGAEKLMDGICDQHLQSCPNFRRKVVVGDPGHEIVKTIESENIDLVIMGSHSRRGLERVIFGSVAEYVVRHSPMPVLVVNPHRFKERQ